MGFPWRGRIQSDARNNRMAIAHRVDQKREDPLSTIYEPFVRFVSPLWVKRVPSAVKIIGHKPEKLGNSRCTRKISEIIDYQFVDIRWWILVALIRSARLVCHNDWDRLLVVDKRVASSDRVIAKFNRTTIWLGTGCYRVIVLEPLDGSWYNVSETFHQRFVANRISR